MVKKAVIVGINYTGSQYALRGCVNDAKNIASELKGRWGYQDNDIRMLTDESGSTELPTFSNIIKGIDWLVDGAKAGDRLWFSYSGHGDQMPDRDGDETDHTDETICPLDFGSAGDISDDILRKKLVDALPKDVNLFCCFDSCHSGTVIDLKYCVKLDTSRSIIDKTRASRSKTHNTRSNFHVNTNRPNGAYPFTNAKLNKITVKSDTQVEMNVTYQPKVRASSCNVVCVSGCRDEQTSADAYINGQNSGALTWALLSILQQHQPGTLKYGELLSSVTLLVKKEGYTQVPQMAFGQSMSTHETVSL